MPARARAMEKLGYSRGDEDLIFIFCRREVARHWMELQSVACRIRGILLGWLGCHIRKLCRWSRYLEGVSA